MTSLLFNSQICFFLSFAFFQVCLDSLEISCANRDLIHTKCFMRTDRFNPLVAGSIWFTQMETLHNQRI
uniref:Secreted protein n=1 Tax=Rhizophora mucronata TaxID=61149 RepID=A0A2P2LR44_RHIMU